MRINAFMRIVPENSAHQCILMRVDNTMSHRQRHVTDVYRMPEAFCKIDVPKGYPLKPRRAIYGGGERDFYQRWHMSENIKKTGLSHSVYQKANLLLLKKARCFRNEKSEFFREIF